MPRFFTLQQAERLLPDVEAAIREAIAAKAEYDRLEAERQSVARRVAILGGVRVDRAQLSEQKTVREAAARALQNAIESIHESGCLVKDLDIGLIDFPALHDGETVLLCWQLGEDEIAWWHRVDDGFAGRRPLPFD